MVLRDGDRSRYDGNGVRKAVEMAEKVVLPAIQGMDVLDQQALDRRLMELDGTPTSPGWGNVTYSTSLAVMRAGCQLRHVSQYRYLNPGDIRTIPCPPRICSPEAAMRTTPCRCRRPPLFPIRHPPSLRLRRSSARSIRSCRRSSGSFRGPPSGDRRHVGVYGPQHRFHGLSGYPL